MPASVVGSIVKTTFSLPVARASRAPKRWRNERYFRAVRDAASRERPGRTQTVGKSAQGSTASGARSGAGPHEHRQLSGPTTRGRQSSPRSPFKANCRVGRLRVAVERPWHADDGVCPGLTFPGSSLDRGTL